MKILRLAVWLFIMQASFAVYAEDGIFDRSTEVNKYLAIIESNDVNLSIEASQEIYYSGITDRRLYDVIEKKIINYYPGLSPNDPEKINYVNWLIKALASSGSNEYRDTISLVLRNSKIRKTRNHAKHQLNKIGWYGTRNAAMASKRYHQEGQDAHVSRHINLLKSDDLTLKRYAAERVSWEGMRDSRIYDAIEQELLRYYEISANDKLQIDTIAWLCRALGGSGDPKYKATLQKVMDSKQAHVKIKRHARAALKKLG